MACCCSASLLSRLHLARANFMIGQVDLHVEMASSRPFNRCARRRCWLGERRQQAGCVAVAALLTEWRARGSCVTARLHSNPRGPNPSPSSPMCCPGSLLSILWTCCGHGRSSGRGSTVEGRRAREVQRPEGGRTDPYDYYYARAVCGVPPPARVSYERAGLTPAATSCTSSYLVGPSGASSVCGVTPSPKNGGRRDYMFGIWRAATMRATRRTCGEGPVGMSLCPAGRWRMRGVRDRDLGPAYAGARLLPEGQGFVPT